MADRRTDLQNVCYTCVSLVILFAVGRFCINVLVIIYTYIILVTFNQVNTEVYKHRHIVYTDGHTAEKIRVTNNKQIGFYSVTFRPVVLLFVKQTNLMRQNEVYPYYKSL